MGKIKREQESGRVVWILVFVAASIFILIFFAAKGRFNVPVHNQTVMTLLAPFQRAASWAGDGIHDGLADLTIKRVLVSNYFFTNTILRTNLEY